MSMVDSNTERKEAKLTTTSTSGNLATASAKLWKIGIRISLVFLHQHKQQHVRYSRTMPNKVKLT